MGMLCELRGVVRTWIAWAKGPILQNPQNRVLHQEHAALLKSSTCRGQENMIRSRKFHLRENQRINAELDSTSVLSSEFVFNSTFNWNRNWVRGVNSCVQNANNVKEEKDLSDSCAVCVVEELIVRCAKLHCNEEWIIFEYTMKSDTLLQRVALFNSFVRSRLKRDVLTDRLSSSSSSHCEDEERGVSRTVSLNMYMFNFRLRFHCEASVAN